MSKTRVSFDSGMESPLYPTDAVAQPQGLRCTYTSIFVLQQHRDNKVDAPAPPTLTHL